MVFGDEVWMGLVDFKSDKPPVSVGEEFNEFRNCRLPLALISTSS